MPGAMPGGAAPGGPQPVPPGAPARYCRNCGNQVHPMALACTTCGAPPMAGLTYCWNCASQTGPGAIICVRCGVALGQAGLNADPMAKSKLVAGLLGILLPFGVHRFYLGYTGMGVAQLLVSIFTCGIGCLWSVIEGVMILVGTSITTDAQGRPLKD
jgi:TM2 domain-containing membrane protein YozV